VCLSFCAALVLAAPADRAEAQPPVAAIACPPELLPALSARLRIELSSASDEVIMALERGELTLELTCEASAVRVRVRGATDLEQRIEGIPLHELRRIAIAMLELSEASLVPGSGDAPPSAGDAPPGASPAASPARPGWLGVQGGVSIAGVPPLLLGTIGLAGEVPLADLIALVVDLDVGFGGVTVDAGSVDASVVSLGVSLRFGGWLGIVELGAGPAVRGGVVVFVGAPTDAAANGRTHVGPWLGLGASAGAGIRLGDQVRLGLDVAGGGAALGTGALVLDVLAARFGDVWFDARASVAVMFP
jgi:hypothetical protein